MAHNPRTFPEVSSQGTILDTGKEAFFAVSATYTESRYYLRNIYTLTHYLVINTIYLHTIYSKLVRDLEVERRNCIFADERDVPGASITVFKLYSQVRNIIIIYNSVIMTS